MKKLKQIKRMGGPYIGSQNLKKRQLSGGNG